jgi:hypothetical protein
MTPEELFDEVLDDLEERLTLPTTQYKLLRAAGLIRLLLMDFEPLADKVVAMKDVEFVVHVPERHALIVQSDDPQDGLSGGMYLGSRVQPRGGQTRSLNRHEFLAHDVASSSWTGGITDMEMLRVATIAFGGLHLMKPSKERDNQVAHTIRLLGGGDIEDLVGHVADIGHITLTALRRGARIQP